MAYVWKHPQSQFWYAAFYDADGKRKNRSTKVRALPSLRDKALKEAHRYESAFQNRRTALQARRVIAEATAELTGAEVNEMTLRGHIEAWLSRKAPEVKPSSLSFYKTVTSGFLSYAETQDLADKDIAQVTRHNITEHRNALAERLAPKTANNHLKALRMLFKDARRESLLVDDPTEFVDTVKDAGERTRRPFKLDELKAILAVANPEWRSLILFALYTGQRLADVAALTWANVDIEKSTIRLTTRKTGKVVAIPIFKDLMNHIAELPLPKATDQNTPVHPHAYEVLTIHKGTNNLSNEFADILHAAGLRATKVNHKSTGKGRSTRRTQYELSFHSLRHTTVTLLHEAGVPMAVAQAIVGHDNQAVHEQYITVGREAMEDAAKAFPKL